MFTYCTLLRELLFWPVLFSSISGRFFVAWSVIISWVSAADSWNNLFPRCNKQIRKLVFVVLGTVENRCNVSLRRSRHSNAFFTCQVSRPKVGTILSIYITQKDDVKSGNGGEISAFFMLVIHACKKIAAVGWSSSCVVALFILEKYIPIWGN